MLRLRSVFRRTSSFDIALRAGHSFAVPLVMLNGPARRAGRARKIKRGCRNGKRAAGFAHDSIYTVVDLR